MKTPRYLKNTSNALARKYPGSCFTAIIRFCSVSCVAALLLSSPVQAMPASVLSDGLIVYYDFNEAPVGGRVIDKSADPLHIDGIVNGSINYNASGKYGNAYNFSPRYAGYITLPNPTDVLPAFTVSMWINTADPFENYKVASTALWYGEGNPDSHGWMWGTHYAEIWNGTAANADIRGPDYPLIHP